MVDSNIVNKAARRGVGTKKSITFGNQQIADRFFRQDMNFVPHFSPGSVLIAAIGNNWKDGCEDKVHAMMKYTRESGYICHFMEFPVYHNAFPNASHAATRQSAAMQAKIGGTEYFLSIDNDVEPEEDLLVNLLKHNAPVIGPYVVDKGHEITKEGNESLLSFPPREKNSGVYVQRWIPHCFILMKVALFNCPEIKFAQDEAEDMFFQRLTLYAHHPLMDTSQILTCASPPGRPDSLLWDDRCEMLKEQYNQNPARNDIPKLLEDRILSLVDKPEESFTIKREL